MKGYMDFWDDSFFSIQKGKMKYMDWNKVQKIVDMNPDSVYAGLQEDWGYTSGLIYAKGKYYDGYVWGCSSWATPIVDVDGKEIECWTYEKQNGTGNDGEKKPYWWGNGAELLSEYSYDGE